MREVSNFFITAWKCYWTLVSFHTQIKFFNRVFSDTWPASMQLYWDKKKNFYIRKEFNSHRIFLVHQHGRRFVVLEHQYRRRDVMWKRCIRLPEINHNSFRLKQLIRREHDLRVWTDLFFHKKPLAFIEKIIWGTPAIILEGNAAPV